MHGGRRSEEGEKVARRKAGARGSYEERFFKHNEGKRNMHVEMSVERERTSVCGLFPRVAS